MVVMKIFKLTIIDLCKYLYHADKKYMRQYIDLQMTLQATRVSPYCCR